MRRKRRIGEEREVDGRFERVTGMTSACISVYRSRRQWQSGSGVSGSGRDEAIRSADEGGESQGWNSRQKSRWRAGRWGVRHGGWRAAP